MTTGVGLLGVKFSDPQPDILSNTQDRRLLTSMVMLPSPSNFGGVDLSGLAITMVETLPRDGTFQSSSSAGDAGISISR